MNTQDIRFTQKEQMHPSYFHMVHNRTARFMNSGSLQYDDVSEGLDFLRIFRYLYEHRHRHASHCPLEIQRGEKWPLHTESSYWVAPHLPLSLGVCGDARVLLVVCQIPSTWGEKSTLCTQSAYMQYIGLVTRWLSDISMIHCQFSALACSGSADVLGGLDIFRTFRYL